MAFKMKGNPMQRNFGKYVKQYKKLPGINAKSEGDTDLPDGRSASSPFQRKVEAVSNPDPSSCVLVEDSPMQKHNDEKEGTEAWKRTHWPDGEARTKREVFDYDETKDEEERDELRKKEAEDDPGSKYHPAYDKEGVGRKSKARKDTRKSPNKYWGERRAAKRKAARAAEFTAEGGKLDQMKDVMAQRGAMGGAVAYKEDSPAKINYQRMKKRAEKKLIKKGETAKAKEEVAFKPTTTTITAAPYKESPIKKAKETYEESFIRRCKQSEAASPLKGARRDARKMRRLEKKAGKLGMDVSPMEEEVAAAPEQQTSFTAPPEPAQPASAIPADQAAAAAPATAAAPAPAVGLTPTPPVAKKGKKSPAKGLRDKLKHSKGSLIGGAIGSALMPGIGGLIGGAIGAVRAKRKKRKAEKASEYEKGRLAGAGQAPTMGAPTTKKESPANFFHPGRKKKRRRRRKNKPDFFHKDSFK